MSTQHWIYAKLESWLSGFGDEYGAVSCGHGCGYQRGRNAVKLVIAVIQPTKLNAVRERLRRSRWNV